MLPETAPPNIRPNITVNKMGIEGDVDELLRLADHLYQGATRQRRDLPERVTYWY